MRSRSPQNLKCGHFTLLFCRGRQRNVPKCKTHVQSDCFCSLNLLFCGVFVAAAVVVAYAPYLRKETGTRGAQHVESVYSPHAGLTRVRGEYTQRKMIKKYFITSVSFSPVSSHSRLSLQLASKTAW